jgi:hypothetical protein
MKQATLTLLSLAVLSSCSQSTAVSARFVNGRLAFIPISGALDCIYRVEVKEVSNDRTVWQLLDPTHSKCTGDGPLFYGDPIETLDVIVAPEPIKQGIIYEVTGVAAGSNYFGGRFQLDKKVAYQLSDVPY